MPAGVRVKIDEHAIIQALNTPGGGVVDWLAEQGELVKEEAEAIAPINDEMDAQHRGGVVGLYAAAFDTNLTDYGSRRPKVHIFNDMEYAIYVEEGGPGASGTKQSFSWTGWEGEIRKTYNQRGYPGRHVLRRALEAAGHSIGVGG